jgi:hypothetical protein
VAGTPIALKLNLSIALFALALFHVVSLASGKITEGDGLGWDGRAYARMVTGSLDDGSPNTQRRPLFVLAARVPHAFGFDVVTSFNALNYLYSFAMYVALGLLLDLYGAGTRAKAVIVGNIALSVSASKMFAFYPVQVDLGALAIITIAFYLVATDRRWTASLACVLAAASREFGVAVALYGIHRAVRMGKPWRQVALVYVPALATTAVINGVAWASASSAGGSAPLGVGDALENVRLWQSPAFILAFVYFGVLLFGGVSALLALRLRWCAGRLREEPELAMYLAIVVGLSAVGSLDIWRYLVFALPVAMVLIAQYCREYRTEALRPLLILMTILTVMTQRPFERMDVERYFRDWFPLYRYVESSPGDGELVAVWSARLASAALAMCALFLVTRQVARHEDPRMEIAG